ncbi:hypothetical protein C6I20_14730 [Aeromicrobium sp. A1-2]|uniref:hypothetical protein n=1 Tax=Aeromicrobium sp. A1-2 TaxID=2107713 RepID=UPI000E51D844|nr:hypothetical protein [Aeromicrobium sp. A1-2]AXT86309.1 hypothetical protein C6I20_14730 [Aeromicrobium sp. A1-2]
MKYFVLRTPGQPDELARWTRRGNSAAFYDDGTGSWIPDPLLAVQITRSDGWQLLDPADLPPGLAREIRQPALRRRASRSPRWVRRLRVGRHARG